MEYEEPVLEIVDVFEREGLLREADPFTMRYLRSKINDIICSTSGDNSDDYELGYESGYESGYEEGKTDGYRDGYDDAREKFQDLLDRMD